MKCFSGLHFTGRFIIPWSDAGPMAKFFTGRKMILRSSTDLCYNLNGRLLIETRNGIDDSQLLLKLLGQQAHIHEDTVNILAAGVNLVEQLFEKALFRNSKIAADSC